ncbi:MAG: endonuclease III [Bdellovibrionota bacterium]
MNKRTSNIITILEKKYKNLKSALIFSNPYECLVSVMLSAQCTDKKVNEVTPVLFQKYRSPKELSEAKIKDVEKIIRQVNYYKTKSKHIVETAKIISNNFSNNIPTTFDELILLPGVGQKTANVVLSELGLEDTFPVDTHVFRVSHRLSLSNAKNVRETEEDLKKIIPKEYWRKAHHMFIWHGRLVCKAQNPKCKECELAKLCDFFGSSRFG